jgi:hypothetical protein
VRREIVYRSMTFTACGIVRWWVPLLFLRSLRIPYFSVMFYVRVFIYFACWCWWATGSESSKRLDNDEKEKFSGNKIKAMKSFHKKKIKINPWILKSLFKNHSVWSFVSLLRMLITLNGDVEEGRKLCAFSFCGRGREN